MLFDAANEGASTVKPLVEYLRPHSFGDFRHREVFRAMQTALAAGQTCDLVSVNSELTKSKQLDAVGSIGYLTELAGNSLPRINFEQHARSLAKLESLRLAFEASNDLQRAISSGDQSKGVATMREVQQRLASHVALADGTHADNSIVSADPDSDPSASRFVDESEGFASRAFPASVLHHRAQLPRLQLAFSN